MDGDKNTPQCSLDNLPRQESPERLALNLRLKAQEILDRCPRHVRLTLGNELLFQCGPVREFGVNGCQIEDVLTVLIDRLEAFQGGQYPSREGSIALMKMQEALMWLNRRTADRKERGV